MVYCEVESGALQEKFNQIGQLSTTNRGQTHFDSQTVSSCGLNPNDGITSKIVVVAHAVTAPNIPAWKTQFPAPH